MTYSRRTNTRRRRTRSTSSPNEQKPILPTNLNSTENNIGRRRTRSLSSPGEQKPILTTPEPQEESIPNPLTDSTEATKEASNPQLVNPSLTNTINQIRSELYEEIRSTLVESDYWDETHSWGADNEIESDDYWHFVGRFE
ncbi:hypothetical protein [Pleurocapsa sp. PCC 7319]|uniref:hypothetical protein n=1 Tax=Pleurocapsa sp. PCC 7319 TaxID=118161 RepID=UPI00037F7F34|nr:hypothetical protein [Pleurocapsa sp. PCC 7319]